MVILSEQGACESSVAGAVALKTPSVTIGQLARGFTLHASNAVAPGVDASSIHINWNSVLGLVENGGSGTLDATYNFWGDNELSDCVSGLVDYTPLLPLPVCQFMAYMEKYGFGPDEAIHWALLYPRNIPLLALLRNELATSYGISGQEASNLLKENGVLGVQQAVGPRGEIPNGWSTSSPATHPASRWSIRRSPELEASSGSWTSTRRMPKARRST